MESLGDEEVEHDGQLATSADKLLQSNLEHAHHMLLLNDRPQDTPETQLRQVADQSLHPSLTNGTCTHRLGAAHDEQIKPLSTLYHSKAIHSLLDIREQLLHPSLLHLLAHGLPQLLFLQVRPPPLADTSGEHRVQRLCPLDVRILGRTRPVQGHKDLHAFL
jgi:hypothetical protein